MTKDTCDRIIVETNEKMSKVINWYLDNQSWLDVEEFHAPMESGCIELQEEGLEVTFESLDDLTVEIRVYPLGIPIPSLTFDYYPATHKTGNFRYPKGLTAQKQETLKFLVQMDRMDWKESIKYHSLMMFAAYYKNIVTVDESKTKVRSKHEVKKLRRSFRGPVPLVRRTYVIANFEERSLKKPNGKRGYTKPDHEVKVKGFFRSTKSGKRIWVKPFSRYKDRGSGQSMEYKI